jgi:hypothetical protein
MKTLHLAPVRLALVTALFLMVGSSRIEAQTPASLAGDWRIVSFFVPKPLTLTKDGNNNVTDIVERNFFGYGLGRVTFTSGGGVSGTFSENGQTPEALSGTFSITGQGQVTVNIPGDEDGPTVFHVNASQDFMVSAQRKGNSLDWVLLLREPSVVPGRKWWVSGRGLVLKPPGRWLCRKTGWEGSPVLTG